MIYNGFYQKISFGFVFFILYFLDVVNLEFSCENANKTKNRKQSTNIIIKFIFLLCNITGRRHTEN